MNDLLTPDEHEAIGKLGEAASLINRIVPDGPNRQGDISEVNAHIHALQEKVMSNAAARAYPERYRLLGATLVVPDDGESGYRDFT